MAGCTGDDMLDSSLFSNVLKQLQDNVLGVKKMQNYFDRLRFVHEPIDGSKLISKLAKRLKQRFQEKIEAVEQLRTAIEDAYAAGKVTATANFPECCKVDPTSKNYRFPIKIFADTMCENQASSLDSNAKHLPKSVLDKMIQIADEKPNTRWQYFGSQEGLYYNFPAAKFADCTSYDHRVRPWYVQGIAPEPKDIVIIIDKSRSMAKQHGGKTLMEIAIEAAITVLDSLNPKDRVGLVAFSSTADTPPGELKTSSCYQNQLATAVAVNIKYLKTYLKSIKAEGNTYYGTALKKAFELLKSPSETPTTAFKRKKVILFLTDGEPTDEDNDIIRVVKQEKVSLRRSTSSDAVIFAYGIGNNDNFGLLKKIADDTEAEGTKGRFILIKEEDVEQLRSVFSSFYDLFATRTVRRSHSLSVPYYDLLGLGTLVSVTVPCWHQQEVIGVAGTDVVFSDLISDVFYFSKGQYSYAFLIDRGTGDTLIHPFMPTLQEISDVSVILHITALEQTKEFDKTVLQSMIRGETAETSFVSKRYFPLGSGGDSGVRELEVKSTYFWKAVEGTNLSVCVVLGENGTETRLATSFNDPKKHSIVYHREIDLRKKKVGFEECSHYGRRATKDRAVVKFSAQSFEKPYDYATLKETEETIDAFKKYLETGQKNPEPKFKPGIRELTIAGLEAERIWDEETSRCKDYTTYLTYATTSGIIVIKPGTVIAKVYDPSQRLWFQNAVNNKGQLTLSTPYLDGLGSGFLIEVMHTLYEGKQNGKHGTNDEVVAVLDASFGLFQFYRLLTEKYPICLDSDKKCFIMDKSGYFVIHKHFIEFDTVSDLKDLSKRIGSIHITELEKSVAEDLIERNVLRRKQCKQYKEIRTENFYEVHLNGTLVSNLCPRYQITHIEGTNAYIGMVDNSKCSRGTCHCPSSLYDASPKECVCPFKSKLEYKYCKNEFPPSSVPLCPVPPPVLSTFDPPEESHETLKNCFENDCKKTNDEETCYRQTSCSWCQYSKAKSFLLKEPFCISNEKCYGGVQGNSLSTLYPQDKKKQNDDGDGDGDNSSNLGVILGCVFAAIAVVILAVFAGKKYRKKLNSSPKRSKSETRSERSASVIPPENPTTNIEMQTAYTIPNNTPYLPAQPNMKYSNDPSAPPPPVNPNSHVPDNHSFYPPADVYGQPPPSYNSVFRS